MKTEKDDLKMKLKSEGWGEFNLQKTKATEITKPNENKT